jgi:hypothetical protein
VEAETSRLRPSVGLGAVIGLTLALLALFCLTPPGAHAQSTWPLYAANGAKVGKAVAVSHAGYGGPGARIWYHTSYFAQIGHGWTELGMIKNRWNVFQPDGDYFVTGSGDMAGDIRRAGANRYTSADSNGTVWLRAIRGADSGPWRIQVFADGRWQARGRAPRSCPGAYAAGAFVAYAGLGA